MPKVSKLGTALITGASSGIGLELARTCAAHGHDVVLVARSQERLVVVAENLRETYNVKATAIELDLVQSTSVSDLMKKLKDQEIDILINNAGFGGAEELADADIERDKDMIRVNATVPTELMAALLPGMVERGRGRVLNIASMAALSPGPGMAVYHATKSYLLSLSQTVHQELDGTGVTVTVLCPGPTKTSWAEHAGIDAERFNDNAASVEDVARAGYRAMIDGKAVAYTNTKDELTALGLRLVPPSEVLKRIRWKRAKDV